MYMYDAQHKKVIDNNTDARTLGDLSDLLEQQDGHRFYKVQPRDSSTIVAVYQVTLKPSGKIYRDRSETNKKTHEHAELVAMKKVTKWLDETMKDLTGQEAISLTTMATSSPCLECQTEILGILVDWRKRLRLKVSYKLRISSLYHDSPIAPKKYLSNEEVKVKLADWKRDIKDSGVKFTLEAIAVCEELPLPSIETRQVNPKNVIRQRKDDDSAIARHVHDINSLRQTKMEEYTVPRANSLKQPKSETDLC